MTHWPPIRFPILQTNDGKKEGSGVDSGRAWNDLESERSHAFRGKSLSSDPLSAFQWGWRQYPSLIQVPVTRATTTAQLDFLSWCPRTLPI